MKRTSEPEARPALGPSPSPHPALRCCFVYTALCTALCVPLFVLLCVLQMYSSSWQWPRELHLLPQKHETLGLPEWDPVNNERDKVGQGTRSSTRRSRGPSGAAVLGCCQGSQCIE